MCYFFLLFHNIYMYKVYTDLTLTILCLSDMSVPYYHNDKKDVIV